MKIATRKNRPRLPLSELEEYAQCIDCLYVCKRKDIENLETEERVFAVYERIYNLVQDCAKCPECKSFGISKNEKEVRKVVKPEHVEFIKKCY